MNKIYSGIVAGLFIPVIGICQASSLDERLSEWNSGLETNLVDLQAAQKRIPKFALSVNLIGFALYGPMANIEVGVKEDLAINLHMRFSEYGLLTQRMKYHPDGLDDIGGITIGGGFIKFFGEKIHRPYGGLLFEYDQISTLYGQDKYWEWAKVETSVLYLFNMGYRFRFGNGIFINTGGFIGVSKGDFEWEYSDLSYGYRDPSPREGTYINPFGMLDLTVGIEF